MYQMLLGNYYYTYFRSTANYFERITTWIKLVERSLKKKKKYLCRFIESEEILKNHSHSVQYRKEDTYLKILLLEASSCLYEAEKINRKKT